MDQYLKKSIQLTRCLFSYGVFDLFRNPENALGYWRHIADAAIRPPNSRSHISLALPRCDMNGILPGAESAPVTLVDYQHEYGDMPLHELMLLCKMVRSQRPKVVFEIGTYLGGTTLQLAANSEGTIYTLDLPPVGHKDYVKPLTRDALSDVYPEQPGIRVHGSSCAHRVSQLFGDSRTFDFSPYHERVDFVLVDGSHHYDFVVHDSRNALKMKSKNGIILWHDYAPYAPGVVQALEELKITPLVHITGTTLVIHYSF